MGILGKIVGSTIGFAIGGPLGAIAGAALGHTFDKSDDAYLRGGAPTITSGEESQFTFFVATFSMLAKLVKADGVVKNEEIDSIEKFMVQDLNLNPESRRVAMNIFRTALDSTETFNDFAIQFYQHFRTQPQLLDLMIDIMLRVSLADNVMSKSEEDLILSAVRAFNFSEEQYRRLKSRYIKDLDKFYSILECTPGDSNEVVKSQYRKRVSEFHPDKIASKGLPDEFVKFANAKFREIQDAYEMVKKERGIR
jgi:DnaJ like chaperone protein